MERVEGRDEIGDWVIGGEAVPDAPRRSDPPPPPPRQRPPSGLATLGCLSPFLIVFYLLFRLTNPSDWVEVTARSIPGDAREVYLIAETSGVAEGLICYHSKVLPFPDRYAYGFTRADGASIPVPIQWRDADRYGVVVRMLDESWRIRWLGPDDLRKPFLWRHLVGGGTAEFHVPDLAGADKPSPSFLDRLELPPQ